MSVPHRKTRLRSPVDATTVFADGSPLSAQQIAKRGLPRRGFGVGVGLGTVVGCALDVLGGFCDIRGLVPAPPTVQEKTGKHLAEVFPFLVRQPKAICFHPNGDNRLLKDVGYGDSALSDHLRSHSESLQCEVEPQTITQPAIAGPDHKIFSLMTLRQAHQLRSFLLGSPFDENVLLGTNESVRRRFGTSRGPHVVVGSPTGNRLSAYLRGKWRRTETGRERELVHEGVSGLLLPFEFSLDHDDDKKVLREDGSYSWGIRRLDLEGKPGAEFRSQPPNSGAMVTDYFLISVIPNHFRADMQSADPVVLLEGCSSVGTSGFELLWRNEEFNPLHDLATEVQVAGAPYWQALFEVRATAPRENVLKNPEDYATDAQLAAFAKVLPDWTLLESHRQEAAASVQAAASDLARTSE